MGKFVPVSDPEKPRNEQDENAMRKHRQFDTPFAQLKEDLNDTSRKPGNSKKNMEPMARQSGPSGTGELEQDANKLWQKKQDLFEKEKSWGRETFQMGNQEQANVDGKKTRDVMAEALFGRAIGFKGGRGNDTGEKVTQRCEVDQALEKNDKGLWVKKKIVAAPSKEEALVNDDDWRCPKCRVVNIRKRHRCRECDFDRDMMAEESSLMRAAKRGEDPRLEAAKKKGRGTADAAAEALKALKARRTEQRSVQDDMGLTRAPDRPKGGGKSFGMNSSSQMVQPSHRHPKYQNLQTVHRSAAGAKKAVEKALGSAAVGGEGAMGKSSSSAAPSAPAALTKEERGRGRSRSPPRQRCRDCSLSLSISPSRSASPPPREDEEKEDVVVDFF